MLDRAPETFEIAGKQTVDYIELRNRLDVDAILDPTGNRQQIPLAPKKIDEHDAEPEIWQRDADQSHARSRVVKQSVPLDRRIDTNRDRNQNSDQ